MKDVTRTKKLPLHPVIRVGENAMLVIIDESIIQKLHINEGNYLEQIPNSEGIFLKISSEVKKNYD